METGKDGGVIISFLGIRVELLCKECPVWMDGRLIDKDNILKQGCVKFNQELAFTRDILKTYNLEPKTTFQIIPLKKTGISCSSAFLRVTCEVPNLESITLRSWWRGVSDTEVFTRSVETDVKKTEVSIYNPNDSLKEATSFAVTKEGVACMKEYLRQNLYVANANPKTKCQFEIVHEPKIGTKRWLGYKCKTCGCKSSLPPDILKNLPEKTARCSFSSERMTFKELWSGTVNCLKEELRSGDVNCLKGVL